MNIVDHVFFFVCLINPLVICGSFALLLHRNVWILKSVIDNCDVSDKLLQWLESEGESEGKRERERERMREREGKGRRVTWLWERI